MNRFDISELKFGIKKVKIVNYELKVRKKENARAKFSIWKTKNIFWNKPIEPVFISRSTIITKEAELKVLQESLPSMNATLNLLAQYDDIGSLI